MFCRYFPGSPLTWLPVFKERQAYPCPREELVRRFLLPSGHARVHGSFYIACPALLPLSTISEAFQPCRTGIPPAGNHVRFAVTQKLNRVGTSPHRAQISAAFGIRGVSRGVVTAFPSLSFCTLARRLPHDFTTMRDDIGTPKVNLARSTCFCRTPCSVRERELFLEQ